MRRQAAAIRLCPNDQAELEHWLSAHRTPQQAALRCRIILAAAQGRSDKFIAGDLNVNYKALALWPHRFAQGGRRRMGRGR